MEKGKGKRVKGKAVLEKDMIENVDIPVNKYFYEDITEEVFINLKIDDKIKVIFHMLNNIGLMCKEIKDVKSKYRTDFIKFGDDIFILKADDWLKEFADKYPKQIALPFNCSLRFDVVTEPILKLLKKAGCYSVHLAVDSTSEHVRENILHRHMNRHIDIVEKLNMARKFGINTWVNYMLAAPGSSLQDDIDTIHLNKAGRVSCPAYTTAVPMIGTDLYDYCRNKNIISEPYDMTGWFKKSILSCFSNKEKNIRYNILLLGAFVSKLPSPLDKMGIVIIKKTPPNILYKFIHWCMYRYFYHFKLYRLSFIFGFKFFE